MILFNFKIHIVGDYFNNRLVVNHGFINNKKINILLSKTFYSITSDENIYSLFTIECINNNVKILTEKKNKDKINCFKNKFIFVSYNNIFFKSLIKKI